MNKNPEKFAIEYLIRNGFKLEEDYNNFARQVVKIAIEALEKQIPKRPLKQRYMNDELIGVCASCKLQWDVAYYQRYCSNCGQRMDWSDE